MALDAGVMSVTLSYAKGLKDGDWFGRQDPYCKIRCGGQQMRTRTAVDGGRNPVWNETFSFNIINENALQVEVYDEDTLSRDDFLGSCSISFARARALGADTMEAPVISKHSHKQRGFVSVTLKWMPNSALRPAGGCYGHGYAAPMMAAPAQPHAQYLPASPYSVAPPPAYPYGAAPPAFAGYAAGPPAGYYPSAPAQPPAHSYYPAVPYPTPAPYAAASAPALPPPLYAAAPAGYPYRAW